MTAMAAALGNFGCGAPGEPTPPTPPVPAAVSDLAAHQAGDRVELTFTLPTKTVEGDPLKEAPAVEILRAGTNADGSPDLKNLQVVSTTPGALVTNYLAKGSARLETPLAPEELQAHAGEKLSLVVRTRASRKRASANSNVVILAVFPSAQPVSGLEARLTESAIKLQWNPTEKTSGGEPIGQPVKYAVYRNEVAVSPATNGGDRGEAQENKATGETVQLETVSTPEFADGRFLFGKRYVYTVRAVLTWNGTPVESADSEPVTITAKDIFPPHAPREVVASVVSNPASGAPETELSWAISGETDLAGYRVYRSEEEGTRGELITPELLPSPALRDTTVKPGHRYWYAVTAVDSAGNESEPSAAISVDVTQPS